MKFIFQHNIILNLIMGEIESDIHIDLEVIV